jgi:hypothetical protein
LPTDDPKARIFASDIIGYLFGYAHLTNTRSLALVGDPDANAYELLFSFSSLHKDRHLQTTESNCDQKSFKPQWNRCEPLQEVEARSPVHQDIWDETSSRLISNFLFRDLIENFPDFGREIRLLVEVSPTPHSMGDNVDVSVDSKFLSFKGIGVHVISTRPV